MLACVLRVVVLVLSLHISGLATAAFESGLVARVEAGCCTDCPAESSGKECPPGCPNCHCVHGQVASLPASLAVLETLLPSSDAQSTEPLEASAPHAPFLPSLYRPPRAVRS